MSDIQKVFFAGLNVDDLDKEMGQYEKDLYDTTKKIDSKLNNKIVDQ